VRRQGGTTGYQTDLWGVKSDVLAAEHFFVGFGELAQTRN